MIGTLEGHTVTHAQVWIPAHGLPWAEVSLAVEAELSGAVTLTIADASWSMAVVSGGPDVGRSHYRLVGGAGGWGRAVAAKPYTNDAGVKLSSVLTDAASEAGEAFATVPPTTKIGPHFAREAAPAARVLEQLVPGAWYVGADGLTYLGARAASTLSTPYAAGPVDLARNSATLAAEEIEGIVPGLVVEGLTVVDVLHELTPGALRSHVWGSAGTGGTRATEAIRAIVEQLFPEMRYRGLFEFRVVTQEGERLNLQPVQVSIGLPSLRRVPVRPGVPGVKATHLLGSRVLVGFVNADPARPFVDSFEDAEGSGFLPSLLVLQNGSKGIARLDDSTGYLCSGPAAVLNYRKTLASTWAPVPAGTGPGGAPAAGDVGIPMSVAAASTAARCG